MFFFFFNIMLMWTIVGVPKVSVLYVYIDKWTSVIGVGSLKKRQGQEKTSLY